ncbi:hypothetical protein F5880DRAFT_892943 [Lentinula raphanica]|nr:hypothetical protein F5880DRAFT_892943 [Lentinula raphanica]
MSESKESTPFRILKRQTRRLANTLTSLFATRQDSDSSAISSTSDEGQVSTRNDQFSIENNDTCNDQDIKTGDENDDGVESRSATTVLQSTSSLGNERDTISLLIQLNRHDASVEAHAPLAAPSASIHPGEGNHGKLAIAGTIVPSEQEAASSLHVQSALATDNVASTDIADPHVSNEAKAGSSTTLPESDMTLDLIINTAANTSGKDLTETIRTLAFTCPAGSGNSTIAPGMSLPTNPGAAPVSDLTQSPTALGPSSTAQSPPTHRGKPRLLSEIARLPAFYGSNDSVRMNWRAEYGPYRGQTSLPIWDPVLKQWRHRTSIRPPVVGAPTQIPVPAPVSRSNITTSRPITPINIPSTASAAPASGGSSGQKYPNVLKGKGKDKTPRRHRSPTNAKTALLGNTRLNQDSNANRLRRSPRISARYALTTTNASAAPNPSISDPTLSPAAPAPSMVAHTSSSYRGKSRPLKEVARLPAFYGSNDLVRMNWKTEYGPYRGQTSFPTWDPVLKQWRHRKAVHPPVVGAPARTPDPVPASSPPHTTTSDPTHPVNILSTASAPATSVGSPVQKLSKILKGKGKDVIPRRHRGPPSVKTALLGNRELSQNLSTIKLRRSPRLSSRYTQVTAAKTASIPAATSSNMAEHMAAQGASVTKSSPGPSSSPSSSRKRPREADGEERNDESKDRSSKKAKRSRNPQADARAQLPSTSRRNARKSR